LIYFDDGLFGQPFNFLECVNLVLVDVNAFLLGRNENHSDIVREGEWLDKLEA
jgi:hypothetical protein